MRIHVSATLTASIIALVGLGAPANAQVAPPFSEIHTIQDELFADWMIEMVDLDQDGDLDLLSGGQGGSSDPLEWHDNEDGHAHHFERRPIDMDARFSNRVVVDFDGDGDLDVIGGNRDGIVLEENLGGARAWETRSLVEDVDARWVGAGDFDGDGALDLVSGGNDVHLHLGDGTMTFDAPRLLSDRDTQLIHVGDLDGDGDTDFVIGTDFDGDGLLRFFFNEDTTFTERDIPVGSGIASLESADLDGDGDADLVLGSDRDLIVLENLGDGIYAPDILDTADEGPGGPGTFWSADFLVAPGDYDLDGDVDIIAAGDHGRGLQLWDNDGSGTFTKRQLDERPYRGRTMDVGDMDCDGDLDFVWGIERDPGSIDAPEQSAWYENELVDADTESCHGPRTDPDPDPDPDPMCMSPPCAGGCSATQGRSPLTAGLLLLGFVALRRRR